ncbi:MAG: hypothetical protein ABI550_04525, partial [Ignavibacteriaceae bacterium]
RASLFITILVLLLIQAVNAEEPEVQLKNYFNNVAVKVKNTIDPVEKRELLNTMFKKVLASIEVVKDYPFLTKKNLAGISIFQNSIQEKYFELNGMNGYQKVADANLNSFASYTVQDTEQALTITITLLGLILIILALIILF